MKRIRVGIIGIGKIGRAQLEAARRLDYADVAAIVVRDEGRARGLCAAFGLPKFYTDYKALLEDPDIDVVHNCTPNLAHFAINRDCLLAGKPILSEKPLTIDARESGVLVDLARERNVPTAVNFVYRHYSILQGLRDMIERGELGDIYAVHGEYLQDWLLRDTDYDWRVEARLGGPSRAIADIGSHWCDLAQFLLGRDIVEVSADLATFIPARMAPKTAASPARRVEVDTEDFGSVLLRFAGGASEVRGDHDASGSRGDRNLSGSRGEAGTRGVSGPRGCFTVSQVSAGRKSGLAIEIDGSQASARWEHSRPDRIVIGRRDQPEEELFAGSTRLGTENSCARGVLSAGAGQASAFGERLPDAQRNMIDSFYRAVLYGEAPRHADFVEGHKIAKVVDAILASDKSGRWEKV